MRGLHAALLEARTAEEAASAIASALRASYPAPATRARDLCLYCKADTTDARVDGNCYSCGSN